MQRFLIKRPWWTRGTALQREEAAQSNGPSASARAEELRLEEKKISTAPPLDPAFPSSQTLNPKL